MSKNKTMSWGWIVFWFILFWPVGIFFLLKKLNEDKSATLKNSKIVFVISYILIGLGVIYLFMVFTEDSSIAVSLIFIGGGIWVNLVAKKMKINGEKYKKYISLIVNQSITQIDSIASMVGVFYDVAKVDLQKMIDAGYFVGAYINDDSREIILTKTVETIATQSGTAQVKKRLLTCKSCGANNSATALQRHECEYCGSFLE